MDQQPTLSEFIVVNLTISKKFANNHIHGSSQLASSNHLELDLIDVSIFPYDSVKEGVDAFKRMLKMRNHINISLYCLAKSGEHFDVLGGQVVIVTEKLDTPIKTDLSTMKEDKFSKIFGLVMEFLKAAHKESVYHGNLAEGVFMRRMPEFPGGHVTLQLSFVNFRDAIAFGGDAKTYAGIEKDFKDLNSLIGRITCMAQNPEYAHFGKAVSSLSPKSYHWVLHNHVLFFDNNKLGDFVYFLFRYQDAKDQDFINNFTLNSGKSDVGKWQDPIKSMNMNNRWYRTYNHDIRRRNTLYSKKEGIIRFLRHAIEHRYDTETVEDVIIDFKKHWPQVFAQIFNQVVHLTTVQNRVPKTDGTTWRDFFTQQELTPFE